MVIGTALIILTWVLFCPALSFPIWAGVIVTVLSSFWILFCMLFGVYFFNLDMKLMAVIKPLMIKMHDKKKKTRKI